MKNFNLISTVGIVIILITFFSCNKTDNNNDYTITFRLEKYFSVTNGDAYAFKYPETSDTTARPEIDTIIGEQIFPNGGNTTIDVYLSEPAVSIIVGIDTISGYYQVYSETPKEHFELNFDFSDEPAKKVYQLVFVAVDEDEFISSTKELKIITIEGIIGDLEVQCEWDNPVDIDLLLKEPNGEIIYYHNPISDNNGYLDHDSNPFCWLDSLNKETIIYDESSAIETGEYKVMTRFLSSCDISDTTHYSVSIKFNGDLVELGTKPNPFIGKFSADETGNDPFDLFTFNINTDLKSTVSRGITRIVYPNQDGEQSLTPKKGNLGF